MDKDYFFSTLMYQQPKSGNSAIILSLELKMRKLILDVAVSLGGYFEGPNGEIDWCIMDYEMDFEGFLSTIETIFYGRVSYEM